MSTSTAIASPNVNAQTNATAPQTIARSARTSKYEIPVRAIRESAHAVEEISVPRGGSSLRASFVMARIYRRQQST